MEASPEKLLQLGSPGAGQPARVPSAAPWGSPSPEADFTPQCQAGPPRVAPGLWRRDASCGDIPAVAQGAGAAGAGAVRPGSPGQATAGGPVPRRLLSRGGGADDGRGRAQDGGRRTGGPRPPPSPRPPRGTHRHTEVTEDHAATLPSQAQISPIYS
ncbi:voltage-dependent calcium channel gamma-8 subunit-like [Canis lupus dingo]|uniref:voltage-dependent calcium channel gamma-8 subunit-like n=1 Tax=Canis lupus dingo TaxID=286419 RepID=UPI0020C2D10C|nr:voltage-dependent calcium channel gamma-8 subunit-like [Canis lupus dingo]